MATEQQPSTTSANKSPSFVTISEAKGRYGGSEGWYRKAVYRRELTYYKRGGRVVFAVEDLDAYFAARRVPARSDAAK